MKTNTFSVLKFCCALCITLLGAIGCDQTRSAIQNDDGNVKAPIGNVELRIDFGDSLESTVLSVPCTAEATVFQVLQTAQKTGQIKFESQGSGTSAFVMSIGGVSNQAAGGRNWLFRVNEKLAPRGCGVTSVKPDDTIEWVFGEYKAESETSE